MTDAEKIQYTTSVFVAMVSEREDRLARGVRMRNAMHEQIARGEKPTGYRPEWLKHSAIKLVQTLQQMASDFDKAHPDDKCSVADLLDVLATTKGLFYREDE